MNQIELIQLELIQYVGNEICEDCGPDRDCEIEYEDCGRICNALDALDTFIDVKERCNMQYEKIKYTILRDSDRRPTVTICEIASNGCVGMGMAIRSMNDNPVEKIGKVKARGRAIKALVRRGNSMPVCRPEAFQSLSITDFDQYNHLGSFHFKSFYCEEV